MKPLIHIFISFLFLTTLSAPAAEKSVSKTKTYSLKDSRLGDLDVKIVDVEEPAAYPLRMTISVLCKDNRVQKNSIKPKLESVLKDDKICHFKEYVFNKDSKILTVRFQTAAADDSGEFQCQAHWAQDFNLEKLCSAWNGK